MARTLKFLTGQANELRKRMSDKHERQAAKSVLDGRLTVGSGNKGQKGDVWGRELVPIMMEAKATAGASLSIKLAWLLKLVSEATAAGRAPRLHLHFASLPWPSKRNWVCLPEDDYKALCERADICDDTHQQ